MTEATMATTDTAAKKAIKKRTMIYDRMDRNVLNASLKKAGIERAPMENGVPAKVMIARDADALQAHYFARLTGEEKDKLTLMQCDPDDGGCGTSSPDDIAGCPFCGSGDDQQSKADVAKEKKAKANGKAIQRIAEKFSPFPTTSTLERLDDSVKRITELKIQGARSIWQIGDELRNVYEHELWKQRIEDGKEKYGSFSGWVKSECDFGHRYALELINVAAAFTESEVVAVGVTKLEVIARVPEEFKGELLERVKQGMPRSELVEQAKRLTGASGAAPRDTGRGGFRSGKAKVAPPTEKAAEAKAKKKQAKEKAGKLGKEQRPDGSIAIVLLKQREVVLLFKRGPKGSDEQRAKRVADEPHGQLALADGRQIYFRLTADPKQQLKLVVEIGQ
jgi:hypothetical protein